MANNKVQKIIKINQAMLEIELILSSTIKKLDKLHKQKMKLIKYYGESGRQAEIEKIRQSLKSI